MDELEKLLSVLTTLRELASRVISNNIVLMKKIQTEPEELIEDVLDDLDFEISNDEILNTLKDVPLEWVSDSERITTELKHFLVVNREEGRWELNAETNIKDCEFLSSVWRGDMYDRTGLEALGILICNLKIILKYSNWTGLVSETSRRIREARTGSDRLYK